MNEPIELGKEASMNHLGKNDNLKRIKLSKLTTDELLTNLANSACASRCVPENQSLENYLADLESEVLNSTVPSPSKKQKKSK